MRMRGQIAGPGVQDATHADLAAEVCGVEGESLQRGSGGLQEQVVHTRLVRAGDGAQFLGQGKGDEKRGHGQQQLPLLVEPPGGGGVLARGTMAVRAGMVAVLAFLARCALGDMTAESFSAAWFNGLHGCQVACGPLVAEAGAGVGAMTPEDVGQLDHGRPRETIRGRACVP